jgi:hypothetical protein
MVCATGSTPSAGGEVIAPRAEGETAGGANVDGGGKLRGARR